MKSNKKRLDQILFERSLAESRTKAQSMIMAGQVYVENKKVTKSGKNFFENSNIKITRLTPEWVSRGALKLIKAIDSFNINIENKICLDIGSSTGGFTQVLLKYNAKKIYSVDVGNNQLHEKLLKEKKIISLQKTNARYLSEELVKESINILVCDVSFISLKKVIKPNFKFLSDNSIIIVLIKPQFEAAKEELRKGIIKKSNIHDRICEDIKDWFTKECNCLIVGLVESPIKGPKGNKEFLLAIEYHK